MLPRNRFSRKIIIKYSVSLLWELTDVNRDSQHKRKWMHLIFYLYVVTDRLGKKYVTFWFIAILNTFLFNETVTYNAVIKNRFTFVSFWPNAARGDLWFQYRWILFVSKVFLIGQGLLRQQKWPNGISVISNTISNTHWI